MTTILNSFELLFNNFFNSCSSISSLLSISLTRLNSKLLFVCSCCKNSNPNSKRFFNNNAVKFCESSKYCLYVFSDMVGSSEKVISSRSRKVRCKYFVSLSDNESAKFFDLLKRLLKSFFAFIL